MHKEFLLIFNNNNSYDNNGSNDIHQYYASATFGHQHWRDYKKKGVNWWETGKENGMR